MARSSRADHDAGSRRVGHLAPPIQTWASNLLRLLNGKYCGPGHLCYDVSIWVAMRMAAWSKAVARGCGNRVSKRRMCPARQRGQRSRWSVSI